MFRLAGSRIGRRYFHFYVCNQGWCGLRSICVFCLEWHQRNTPTTLLLFTWWKYSCTAEQSEWFIVCCVALWQHDNLKWQCWKCFLVFRLGSRTVSLFICFTCQRERARERDRRAFNRRTFSIIITEKNEQRAKKHSSLGKKKENQTQFMNEWIVSLLTPKFSRKKLK